MNRNGKHWKRATCAVLLAVVASVSAFGQARDPQQWNKKDLKEAIATAKTSDDHRRIAEYFKREADRLETEAKDHAELATAYRKSPTSHEQKHPMSGPTAGHCDWLAQRYKTMAQKTRELATMHTKMATSPAQ